LLAAVSVGVSQEVGFASAIAGFFYLGYRQQDKSRLRRFAGGFGAGICLLILFIAIRYGFKNYVTSAILQTSGMVIAEIKKFPSIHLDLFRQARLGSIPWFVPWQNVAEVLAGYVPVCVYAAVLLEEGLHHSPVTGQKSAAAALAVYGLGTAVTAWGRSDAWHVFFAVSPALLLGAYWADRIPLTWDKKQSSTVLGILLLGALITLPNYFARIAKQKVLETMQRPTHIVRAGSSRLPYPQANGYEFLVDWIHSQTPPGEPILFFPYDGCIYFLADRPNPTSLPVLAFGVRSDLQKKAVEEIQASTVRWAIWDTEDTSYDGVPIEKFLNQIYSYLTAHFRPREKAGPFVFLERIPTVDSHL